MLEVPDFWAAIDRLAQDRGLTLAQLARLAQLPESALLAETRRRADGSLAWPSLEMLTRIADATGIGLQEFGRLVDEMRACREAERRSLND